ncbi:MULTISPECIES: hypothetical protein [unclassified Bradyrhizobium]|uniref:hypothetical protein n=1 Tax=unclassified Bradyrhizobium TaxID=2631580 RepID=UPI00140C2127|nr:hypothetical protein [Bradyrhizobium sp. 2S1]MCK7668253.1 hypothetical protein [Bradyrhizobium sp. 2S1]
MAEAIPLHLTASLTSKGTIISRAEVSRLSQMTSNNGFQEVPLAELVEQVLAADNLRRDEIGEPELDALLHVLETSIQRVRATIALLKYRKLDDQYSPR